MIISTEVIVPAALTLGENSGRIPSGPNGSGRLLLFASTTVIIGGHEAVTVSYTHLTLPTSELV